MERIKWRYSEEIVNYINTNNIPILAIVGATGSGKSTLASYLELQYPKLKIIRNYTTRTKRNTDCETHFGYISEYEFCEMMKADAFFLARYQEFPFYGYRNEDLLNIINAGQIPLFMFRYSGTNIITKIIKNVYIVLIATVYKGNIIKNLIMDCQSYTKYRPNETTGGIFVSWRRKEELPTGA